MGDNASGEILLAVIFVTVCLFMLAFSREPKRKDGAKNYVTGKDA